MKMNPLLDTTRGVEVMPLLALILLSGCGGGGGSASVGSTLPTIATVAPADGATEVAIDAQVAVTFSKTMDCATLNAGAFTVKTPDEVPVSGQVVCNEGAATFKPSRPLRHDVRFTATVTAAAKDAAGNAVAAPHSWSFTRGPQLWRTDKLIGGDGINPRVATDADGDAIAVWLQQDQSHTSVWHSRFIPGLGWGEPAVLETDDRGGADTPQIAMNDRGEALVVWQLWDGTRNLIQARRFDTTGVWGDIVTVSGGTEDASEPQVAIDQAGNAIVAWTQAKGLGSDVVARVYVGSAWVVPITLQSGTDPAHQPHVAMGPNGNAMVVFLQTVGSEDSVYATRFVAGTGAGAGWSGAGLIEHLAGPAYAPKVAFDRSGAAIAVWTQNQGLSQNILATRFTPDGGWDTTVVYVSDTAGNTGHADIAFDGAGAAYVVWPQVYIPPGSTVSQEHVGINRWTAANGWDVPITRNAGKGTPGNPSISASADNTAVVVWREADTIAALRYSAGAWSDLAVNVAAGAQNATSPKVAQDSDGNATVVWVMAGNPAASIAGARFE